MKAHHISIVSAVLVSLFSFGCKNNPATPGSGGSPTVTIVPSEFHGVEFQVDTFKARIANHDFAETYFTWDMGDTMPTILPQTNAFQAIHQYVKPGIYSVTVKAYDIYSNQVIATSTEKITIDTATSSVEIIPQFYFGSMTTNMMGTCDKIDLAIKTSLPIGQLDQYWEYGDGTYDTARYGEFKVKHSYPKVGTYLVKVRVYQKSGVFVGTDTSLITINLPEVTLDMLTHATRFQEHFYVDNSYSQFDKYRGSLPFSMALHFRQDSTHVSSWNGLDFSIAFHQNSIEHDSIKGTIAPDLKSVNVLKVSVSQFNSSSNNANFGYVATDLKLLGVTADGKIIYKLSGADARNNLQNILFQENGFNFSTGVSYVGQPDYWTNYMPPTLPDPVVVLVFDNY